MLKYTHIYENIPLQTLFMGRNLLYFDIIDSTNTFLIENTEQYSEGTVVVAGEQTAGRGQRGNQWLANPNENLTFSILLKPNFIAAQNQFELNMMICLALQKSLSVFLGEGTKIKWSNDIFFGNKKIAGVLIENTLKGTQIESSVIGIGLNVNQTNFEYPHASSMQNITGKKYLLENILITILKYIEEGYLLLKNTNISLKMHYLTHLFRFNEKAFFKTGNQIWEGKIIEVENSGKLVIENLQGICSFEFKQVEFII
ncbi:MAG: biotin--[acetyl-CoA-carboxylase] ligase [Bacteroidetes bacterium]|nr:MAG: biotin--[acetyl-CoA-carboxylase] ligase [Bacteroidota bacterium]TAG88211.1 MAG: biotin--[acetyl-CoA-carboxylase] ligase [Bacteroidota bacterium]